MGGGSHKGKSLFDEITSLENLLFAWQEFKRGKRSKADVLAFEFDLEQNLLKLHKELHAGIYQPAPYLDFYITDPKLRHIHKACVRDRVVHQAAFRIFYQDFDRQFIFDSYSCRAGKGTHRAVKRLEDFCRKISRNFKQPVFALKCDIKKFFDSIDHEILKNLLAARINCQKTLRLLDVILGSFRKSPGKGLPLGNVTSQLFANIYLNQLDQFIKHGLKVRMYIRYTDDFIIVSRDESYLHSLVPPMQEFLNNALRLQIHPRKVVLRKLSQGIDFLGYVVLPRHIVLRTATKKRMFKKLFCKQKLLERGLLEGKSFNQSLQSYLGILKHCGGHKLSAALKNNFQG